MVQTFRLGLKRTGRVKKLDQKLCVRKIWFPMQDLSVTQPQDCVHSRTGAEQALYIRRTDNHGCLLGALVQQDALISFSAFCSGARKDALIVFRAFALIHMYSAGHESMKF